LLTDISGQTCDPPLILDDGETGCPKTTMNYQRIKAQKRQDLNNTAAEAWNLVPMRPEPMGHSYYKNT
jgi:hypothetical protein